MLSGTEDFCNKGEECSFGQRAGDDCTALKLRTHHSLTDFYSFMYA